MKTSKQKATTFRLNPEVNAALEAISEHIGATKNKIVNEALADYLKQRGEKLQTELDGVDLLPWLAEGDAAPERTFFWEMSQQTAVRRGPWKLVLNGVLVEGTEPEDDVHLANLEEDLGERENLINVYPDLTAELKAEAEAWRDGVEGRWETEWKPIINGTTGFPTGEIEE